MGSAADFDRDLERLAALLASGGRESFLRSPIVTPEPLWFPDVWTPDLESVRRLAARLLAYAGLPALDAECGHFVNEREPEWLPPLLRGTPVPGEGAAALFLGIEEGCAYFAVEVAQLERPDDLVGVLAHEVAHAWRRSREVEVADRAEEEELTDLTTVALGFGILTANASYAYQVEGGLDGAYGWTRWSHRELGYLGPERLARVLAAQALLRGEDLRVMGRHLRATQRDAFDSAARELDPAELAVALGLAPDEVETAGADQGPPQVIVRPGRTARAVHACVERVVSEVGEEGGFLDRPMVADFEPLAARHRPLAVWGRPRLEGGWMRQLTLVEDPEWTTNLVVLECSGRREAATLAMGLLPDGDASRPARLCAALRPLFDGADLATLLEEDLPAFVGHPGRRGLGMDHLADLLTRAVQRLAPERLGEELAWLKAPHGGAWARLQRESGRRTDPAATERCDPRRASRIWWDHVTSPETAKDEWEAWNLVQSRE